MSQENQTNLEQRLSKALFELIEAIEEGDPEHIGQLAVSYKRLIDSKGFEYCVYTQDGALLLVTANYRIAHDYALGYKTRTGESLVVKTNRKEN